MIILDEDLAIRRLFNKKAFEDLFLVGKKLGKY